MSFSYSTPHFPETATQCFYFDHVMRGLSKLVLELKRVIHLIHCYKFTGSYDSATSFCRTYALILPQILLLLAVAKARREAKKNEANSRFANHLQNLAQVCMLPTVFLTLLVCRRRELKELRNFILSQCFQISEIVSSFKWLY